MKRILTRLAALLLFAPALFAQTDQQSCLRRFVAPVYPVSAHLVRMQGTVRVKVTLDSKGAPQSVSVVDAGPVPTMERDAPLQRAAVDAIKNWRFCAQTSDSSQKELILTVNFRLKFFPDTKSDRWYPTEVTFEPPATVSVTAGVSQFRTD